MTGKNAFERALESRKEEAYALMRFASGLLFSVHGMQKVFGVLTEKTTVVLSQAWFGGVIELVCGLAIAVGFRASPAAFLASGTMAVAYTQFHWKLQMGKSFFPVVNKGELALVYAVVFLFIACAGSGKYSLDRRR